MQISSAAIDIAVKAIRDEINRLQAGVTELLQLKAKPTYGGLTAAQIVADVPSDRRKKKTAPAKPLPKRPAAVRRFATQVDIVRVLEHADGPLTEFKIKEALDELLNVKPSDPTLEKVLNATKWHEGAKRYRKNDNGEYELYEPQDDDDDDA